MILGIFSQLSIHLNENVLAPGLRIGTLMSQVITGAADSDLQDVKNGFGAMVLMVTGKLPVSP